MHEWPLLIFTILIQTAIGGIVAITICTIFTKKSDDELLQMVKMPLLVISGLSLVGLAASFSHLGTPLHALYTIVNIGSSWFSREILFVGLFIFLTLLTTIMALWKKNVNKSLLAFTAFIGMCTVFVMSSIYAFSLIEAWPGVGTYAAFYAATFLIGAALIGLLVKQQTIMSLLGLFVLAASGLLLKTLLIPIHFSQVAETVGSTQLILLFSQLALTIIGVVLLGYVAIIKRKHCTKMLAIIFFVIFIGEFFGRYMFFMNAI